MALKDLVIQSQLIPPRQRKGVLRRARLDARLAAILDYPLTLVLAGTGCGKSTALASLAGSVGRLFWYSIAEPDRDPLLFLAHLICAFECQTAAWGRPALDALEASGGRVGCEALNPLLNALTLDLNREAVLVLDDYHLVADVPEIAALVEHLVDYAPACLHVVVASRYPPAFSALARWRVKGQVLNVGRADLAFTTDEIEALFRDQYRYPLSAGQAQALADETEGWAIALPLVWQSLQAGTVPDLEAVLARLPSTLEALFDYLAQDVLARQPAAIQHFMVTTAVLRELDGPVCDHLLEVTNSAVILRALHDDGLFLVAVGDQVYRYHRLFHDFLEVRLGHNTDQLRALHRRAAAYFEQTGHPEETVYHLLHAEDYAAAAGLLQHIGADLIRVGRFESLTGWINCLPEAIRCAEPGLDLLLGDVCRLRADFDEALDRYAAAERCYAGRSDGSGRSRALRGQAQVFLDTIRPLKADSLLEEALRLLEPQEHRHETAILLDQLAENKLNLGHPDEAQALHHEARLLRAESDPDEVYLEARALLRTGQLAAGRLLLEHRAEQEREAAGSRPQRFHRETALLLSLFAALQGDRDAARHYAQQGIALGRRLLSPFVEAVGTMRLGHAAQLGRLVPWSDWAQRQALACYRRAIELVHAFKVTRVQVEPLWGLARAYGFSGDWQAAARYAGQALDIVAGSGDEWIGNLVRVTLGASYVLAGRADQALPVLADASAGFSHVGDPFGQCAAWLWLAIAAWGQGDGDHAMELVSQLLPVACQHGYDYLLIRETFLGLEDAQAALPLLLEARRRGVEAEYAGRLLDGAGLADADHHPGYGLAVRTLGTFGVWRRNEAVTARDWQREKARQVFQLLLTQRGQWLYREQIVDQLWPHLPPDAAERDFKVALNAIHRALEPARPPWAAPFFLIRRGNLYGLNPAARLVVDADLLAALGEPAGPGSPGSGGDPDDLDALRQALALYEDDYLPDCLYEDWASATRERLRSLYLAAAERLAVALLDQKAWSEVIDVCQAMLARDNCWEAAYRLLMRAYAAQGKGAQVYATYARCVNVLHDELAIEPSPSTQTLYQKLIAS